MSEPSRPVLWSVTTSSLTKFRRQEGSGGEDGEQWKSLPLNALRVGGAVRRQDDLVLPWGTRGGELEGAGAGAQAAVDGARVLWVDGAADGARGERLEGTGLGQRVDADKGSLRRRERGAPKRVGHGDARRVARAH